MRELRAEDRGVAGVAHRVDVVHEAARAAQQRLVLEARERPAHPGLPGEPRLSGAHRAVPPRARSASNEGGARTDAARPALVSAAGVRGERALLRLAAGHRVVHDDVARVAEQLVGLASARP